MSKWLYSEYLVSNSDYNHICHINRNRIYLAVIIFKKVNHVYIFKGEVAIFLASRFSTSAMSGRRSPECVTSIYPHTSGKFTFNVGVAVASVSIWELKCLARWPTLV